MPLIAPLLALLAVPPRVLVMGLEDDTLHRSLANAVAQRFGQAKWLEPIVPSPTDPIWRETALKGRLPDKIGDRKTALQAARELNAPYVLEFKIGKFDQVRKAEARLLVNGRERWSSTEEISAVVGGVDSEDAALMTVARTWLVKLGQGPLKEIAGPNLDPEGTRVESPKPNVQQDPPPAPHLQNTVVTPPTPPAPPDDSVLEAEIARLVKEDKLSRAMEMARDAVDQRPLSPSRRKILVELMMRAGDLEGAARQARSAAELMPTHGSLRILAARAWMRAGRLDEAKSDLNEALARNVAVGEAQTLVAELELRRGRPEVALKAADAALAAGPSPDAVLARGVAHALLGDPEGAKADVAILVGLKDDAAPDRARRVGELLDPQFTKSADAIRTLTQRAAVRRDDAEVTALVTGHRKGLEARLALIEGLVVPEKEAQARRLLAHRLLAQSVSALADYLESGEPDALRDARMDLGEALRTFKG